MVTLERFPTRWLPRGRLSGVFDATVLVFALVITLSQLGRVEHEVSAHPALWVMAGLAALAGTQAFMAAVPPRSAPMTICPTICFSFAILLCWGLGPALLAQFAAIAVVAWRLRRSVREAIMAAGQYTLSFTAAAIVLWAGEPDPFHKDGGSDLMVDALTVVGAVAAWLAVFGSLALIGARLRSRGRYSRLAAGAVGNQVLFNAALLLLSPVLAVTAHIDIGFVPLVFVPLYAVQRMARLSTERDRAAQVDPLTGLANRTGLKNGFDELTIACDDATAGRPDRRPTLLILDLDRFKQVNDALGHDVGDRLLIAVAGRLATLQPEDGIVARLGGDEFAILTATSDPGQARHLADTVVHALSAPVSLDGLRVDVTASVGIAVHGDDEDFTSLMRHADIAMYEAKQRGDTIAAYTPGSDVNTPERLGLLTDFRHALESGDRGQISMYYQPQVCLATGEVAGVEALLRWRHPVHGPIDTQELLNIAEHSSVMHLLTARVIEDVVAQVAEWAADGITLRASINVSARDLYSDEIVDRLSAQLTRHRVPPDQIQIEITESALIADPTRVLGTVAQVSALGVAVALDDFGTGYSSLQHLRKLPITEIKIDRSFVSGMAHNHDDAAIVRSTVEMARSLGIRTVAEGVECEYTRQLLADAGCTLVQGWLTAYPMPAGEIGRWLTRTDARGCPPRSMAELEDGLVGGELTP